MTGRQRITITVATAIAVLAPAAGAQVAQQLPAPVQSAPPDGAVLRDYPRITTLRWQPVDGAAKYQVEVEACAPGPYPPRGSRPISASCARECRSLRDAGLIESAGNCGYSTLVVASTEAPEHTFDFKEAEPGRWRVSAVDASGQPGPPSPWWEFRYTDGRGPASPPGGTVAVTLPRVGLSFDAPRAWRRVRGTAPLVYAVQSGASTVALWHYRRSPDEELPTTHRALVEAKNALLEQIRTRDPSFKLIKAKLLRVSSKRAVQVLGIGKIAGRRRMIRSTHVYAYQSEDVVDAYTTLNVFDRVDRRVFAPLLGSLRIVRPRG